MVALPACPRTESRPGMPIAFIPFFQSASFRDDHLFCSANAGRARKQPRRASRTSFETSFGDQKYIVGHRLISLDIVGYRWISLDIILDIAGYPWISFDIIGYRWISSEFVGYCLGYRLGYRYRSLDVVGHRWIIDDIRRYLVICCDNII